MQHLEGSTPLNTVKIPSAISGNFASLFPLCSMAAQLPEIISFHHIKDSPDDKQSPQLKEFLETYDYNLFSLTNDKLFIGIAYKKNIFTAKNSTTFKWNIPLHELNPLSTTHTGLILHLIKNHDNSNAPLQIANLYYNVGTLSKENLAEGFRFINKFAVPAPHDPKIITGNFDEFPDNLKLIFCSLLQEENYSFTGSYPHPTFVKTSHQTSPIKGKE
jgi:hypothetical protein